MDINEIQSRLANIGIRTSVNTQKSIAVLKGIVMNPACKPETRQRALAELEERLKPATEPAEPSQTA